MAIVTTLQRINTGGRVYVRVWVRVSRVRVRVRVSVRVIFSNTLYVPDTVTYV